MSGFITAAVITAVGIGVSTYETEKGRAQQKKANRRAEQIDSLRNQRARSEALRTNRVNAANVFALASNAGVAGGSATQGALGSLQTNSASNFNFSSNIEELNRQQQSALNSASNSFNAASLAQQGAKVGSGLVSSY